MKTFQTPSTPDRDEIAEDLPIGGQAVIEGVMMRVPGRIVTAVRAPDGRIAIRTEVYTPITKRLRWLGVPVLRGAVSFFEMLVIGMRALSFSADVAMKAERDKAPAAAASPRPRWQERLMLSFTLVVSLGLGIGVFFFVPLAIAQLLQVERSALTFNLAAGAARVILLLAYLWGISRWGEIRRVFEYHGAEHKTIFAREAGAALTVAEARSQPRLHPRCGTSFMLIVVLIAIAIFAVVDSLFPLVIGHPQSLAERFLTHLSLLPLVGGVGFELLKLSGRKRHLPLARWLMTPGLWLQRITTREPDDGQLEVALAALRTALGESAEQTGAAAAAGST